MKKTKAASSIAAMFEYYCRKLTIFSAELPEHVKVDGRANQMYGYSARSVMAIYRAGKWMEEILRARDPNKDPPLIMSDALTTASS